MKKIRSMEFRKNIIMKRFDVDGAKRFRFLKLHQLFCYDILPVNIVQEFQKPILFHYYNKIGSFCHSLNLVRNCALMANLSIIFFGYL